MTCDTRQASVIFKIVRLSRQNKGHAYVFVGEVSSKITSILSKIEKGSKPNDADKKNLSEHFGRDYNAKLGLHVLHGPESEQIWNKVTFIYDYINSDDSVFMIRKKIFIYLSEPSKNKYLIETNQELWVELEEGKEKGTGEKSKNEKGKEMDNTFKILGYYYDGMDIVPSIYNKFEVDNDFITKDGDRRVQKDKIMNDNSMILTDLVDIPQVKNTAIYLSYLDDEKEYIKLKTGKEIEKKVLNGYILKYWPYGVLKVEYGELKDKFKGIKNRLDVDNYILELVRDTPIPKEFCSSYYISSMRISVNNQLKHEKKYINLLKIYKDLRLSEKIPFMSFKSDEEDGIPPYQIYKPIVNIVPKIQVVSWVKKVKKRGDKLYATEEDEFKRVKGLTIKYLQFIEDGKHYYSTIHIYANGHYEIELNYTDSYQASIKNIQEYFESVGKLIDSVNQIDYIIGRHGEKLEKPGLILDYEQGVIRRKPNTIISNLNAYTNISLGVDYNYPALGEFAKCFTPIVSTIAVSKKDKRYMNELRLRYKRVSNFKEVDEIYERIIVLREAGEDEFNIVRILSQHYQLTLEEATQILDNWNRNFSKISTGITITIKGSKISLTNIKELAVLPTVNHFIVALITLFQNRDKLKKNNKDFKKYIIDYCGKSREDGNYNSHNDDLIEDLVQTETGDYTNSTEIAQVYTDVANIEQILDNFNTSYDNLADKSDVDVLAYTNGVGKNGSGNGSRSGENRTLKDISLDDEEIKKSKHVIHTVRDDVTPVKGNKQFDEYDINVRIDSDCPEIDYQSDVCKDPCHDLSYRLRRLQKHDAHLWRSDISKEKSIKHSTVSRSSCQKKNQPIVMRNDPEKDPNIDRSSFTYAVKYGSDETHQNYYICPKVWCPHCEKPIPYDKVKGTIIDRKGVKCKTAKCPSCKGEAMVTPTMLDIYPGFSHKARMDGLCVPCCKKKSYLTGTKRKIYDLCTKQGKGDEDEGDTPTNLYILGREKPKQDTGQAFQGNLTPFGRYSMLPLTLSKILKTKSEPGYTNPNDKYYLRKGININNNQSFLEAIADIISDNSSLKSKKDKNVVLLKDLKELIYKSLDQKIFDSLKNGMIKIMFHNPNKKDMKALDNYRAFLKSEEQFINEEYVWDLLQRPGVITPEGLNILIITPGKVKCPLGINPTDFYRTNRPTALILQVGNYYEPIYMVRNKDSNISETSIYDSSSPDISKLLDQVMTKCKVRENRVAYDNELLNYKLYNIPYIKYLPELSLTRTLSEIQAFAAKKNNRQYLVKTQYVDAYNKVSAIILNNNGFIPVQPSGIRTNIDFTTNAPIIRYREQVKILDELARGTKIPCKPIRKVSSYDGHMVVGILTEAGRIVPVYKEKLPSNKLGVADIYFYSDANKEIADGYQKEDERLNLLRKYNYEDESYQRFRFEISKYVVRHEKDLEHLSNLIKGKSGNGDGKKDDSKKGSDGEGSRSSSEKAKRVGKQQRVNDVKKYLAKLADKLVKVEPEGKLDLRRYDVPNRREACFFKNEIKVKESERLALCKRDPHCILVGKTCKLRINKNNLITKKENLPRYLIMLADELVNNKNRREEILEDKIDDIIDTSRFELTDDSILVSRINILRQIDNLYNEAQEIYISPAPMFDTTQPALTPLEIKGATQAAAHTEESNEGAMGRLGDFWSKYFDKRYKFIRTPESQATVINVMFKALKSVDRDLTMAKMKENLVDFIDELDVDTVKRYFFKSSGEVLDTNLGWKLLLEAYKTIDPRLFRAVDDFRQLSNLIESSGYEGTLVDMKLLAILYKTRVILLNKKAGEEDENDASIVADDLVTRDQYILVLANIKKSSQHFYLVEGKGQKVFAKNDLPPAFREFIFEEDLSHMIPGSEHHKKSKKEKHSRSKKHHK